MNAQALFLDPNTHDEIVALTSHLPYLISTLLTLQVAEEAAHDRRYWRISATGLRDSTRLAGSNPQMMLDILSSNRESILKQLIGFDEKVQHLIRELEKDDVNEIAAWLQEARLGHEAYLGSRWNMQDKPQSKDVDE